jgi:hypothetical protein
VIEAEDALEPRPSSATNPDGLANDDAVEPGGSPVSVTQAASVAPGLLEPGLHGVSGVHGVVADEASQAKEPVVVLDDEGLEGAVPIVAPRPTPDHLEWAWIQRIFRDDRQIVHHPT